MVSGPFPPTNGPSFIPPHLKARKLVQMSETMGTGPPAQAPISENSENGTAAQTGSSPAQPQGKPSCKVKRVQCEAHRLNMLACLIMNPSTPLIYTFEEIIYKYPHEYLITQSQYPDSHGAAIKTWGDMKMKGSWPSKVPVTEQTIKPLFKGKMMMANHAKIFKLLIEPDQNDSPAVRAKFIAMCTWLDQEENDHEEMLELWEGVPKGINEFYSLNKLEEWIQLVRQAAVKEKKEKKKSHKKILSWFFSAAQTPFPDIPFSQFNEFIHDNFGNDITLAAQVASKPNEMGLSTSWIHALAFLLLQHKFSENKDKLYTENECIPSTPDAKITSLALKLDALVKDLGLFPYRTMGKLKSDAKHAQIPHVTLIKGATVHKNAFVLHGKCRECLTIYYADHERFKEPDSHLRLHLNNASYLKVGQTLWIDRACSRSVLSCMYSFHGSASAVTQHWNNSWGIPSGILITHRHIWQAFVQESTQMVAFDSNTTFTTPDNSNIDEIIQQAYLQLGNNGVIAASKGHACSECTHPYRATVGEDAPNAADGDYKPINMVVVDGIVMGPTHCAYPGCERALANARGESFCGHHLEVHGNKCRAVGCNNLNTTGTRAYQQHQTMWNDYQEAHTRGNLSGICRIIHRPDEALPWQNHRDPEELAHDCPQPDDENDSRKHYFGPSKFYCVETACAPCGAVIAWTKFDKSESPTKILALLKSTYPNPDDRPSYICIDTRWIVDTYYYKNHKDTDTLCKTWCNPTPEDGSNPNLITIERDNNGQLQARHHTVGHRYQLLQSRRAAAAPSCQWQKMALQLGAMRFELESMKTVMAVEIGAGVEQYEYCGSPTLVTHCMNVLSFGACLSKEQASLMGIKRRRSIERLIGTYLSKNF
ncbi:hypothetical protein DFP72DRAFT_851376 [Ephemerocybe angulata]|uniref:CxC6 like cysteine cluster associated with KDZ domain-containing protein n=1 Tax=Ephemerocybe angulata TaxID=980116 RepID=A0A8H6HS28_9AGAR|nr:hypothetical protein DFP72DRAFT_851376 [Tulosesus angulatus]